jgi:hypothetical protein
VHKKILYEEGGKLGILMYSKKGGVLVFMRFFLGIKLRVRRLSTEVGGQRSEVRGQRTDNRGQRSEDSKSNRQYVKS